MFPPDPGPGQHLSRNARISASNIFVVNIQSIFLIWRGMSWCMPAVVSYQAPGYSEQIKSHDNLNDLVRKDPFDLSESEAIIRKYQPIKIQKPCF